VGDLPNGLADAVEEKDLVAAVGIAAGMVTVGAEGNEFPVAAQDWTTIVAPGGVRDPDEPACSRVVYMDVRIAAWVARFAGHEGDQRASALIDGPKSMNSGQLSAAVVSCVKKNGSAALDCGERVAKSGSIAAMTNSHRTAFPFATPCDARVSF
jgi:hypothetical protein